MDLNQIPLFAMLKDKLGYTAQRQKVIAQNVANADTPGFAPRDMTPFASKIGSSSPSVAMPMLSQASLQSGQIEIGQGAGISGAPGSTSAPDSEIRLDGNRVVLEEQMMKMTEARTDYDAAIGLYQTSLNMMRTAIRKPGG